LASADLKRLLTGNFASGLTGGRYRSMHVTEWLALRLRDAGLRADVTHPDLRTCDLPGRLPPIRSALSAEN
jgi:RNase adaptor protein for sRNA GlmZ degradation